MLAMLGTSELTQVVWTLAAVVEQNSPNTIRQPVRAWRERESRGLLLVFYTSSTNKLLLTCPDGWWTARNTQDQLAADSIRGGQLYGPGRGGMDSAEGGVAQGEQKMGN